MAEDRPEINSPMLQQLFSYWDSRRRGRLLPRRSDIEPTDIPRLLPHVLLIAVERNGEGPGETALRFRIRLSGTYLEAAFQQFGGGRYIDDMKLNGEIGSILTRYRECAETGRPVLSRHAFINEDLRRFDYERLLLPLALDDETKVDMIFGGVCFAAPLPTPSGLTNAARPGMEQRRHA